MFCCSLFGWFLDHTMYGACFAGLSPAPVDCSEPTSASSEPGCGQTGLLSGLAASSVGSALVSGCLLLFPIQDCHPLPCILLDIFSIFTSIFFYQYLNSIIYGMPISLTSIGLSPIQYLSSSHPGRSYYTMICVPLLYHEQNCPKISKSLYSTF